MTETIRWSGPYPQKDKGPRSEPLRHADSITMDHIIELRNKIHEQEKYIQNYERHLFKIRRTLVDIRDIIRHSDEPATEILRVIEDSIRGL